MSLELSRIDYRSLNARQKENYNFQKVSAVLADYGFVTLRLSADWQSADFIAQHVDGETFIKVQLKGRLTFWKKYRGKGLYVAFHNHGDWYLFPHDEVLERFLSETNIGNTKSWTKDGRYSFPSLSMQARELLKAHRI
jgi:hypothetical protein